MGKPSKELQLAMLDADLLPSRRLQLEREFHEWAKNTGTRVDVFNVIGWLQEKGLMLSDHKLKLVIEVRDELKRSGWMQTAAKLEEVFKDYS